jgi:hypothetical protein
VIFDTLGYHPWAFLCWFRNRVLGWGIALWDSEGLACLRLWIQSLALKKGRKEGEKKGGRQGGRDGVRERESGRQKERNKGRKNKKWKK